MKKTIITLFAIFISIQFTACSTNEPVVATGKEKNEKIKELMQFVKEGDIYDITVVPSQKMQEEKANLKALGLIANRLNVKMDKSSNLRESLKDKDTLDVDIEAQSTKILRGTKPIKRYGDSGTLYLLMIYNKKDFVSAITIVDEEYDYTKGLSDKIKKEVEQEKRKQ